KRSIHHLLLLLLLLLIFLQLLLLPLHSCLPPQQFGQRRPYQQGQWQQGQWQQQQQQLHRHRGDAFNEEVRDDRREENLEQSLALIMETINGEGSSWLGKLGRLALQAPLLWARQKVTGQEAELGGAPFRYLGAYAERQLSAAEEDIEKRRRPLAGRILDHLLRTRVRLSVDQGTKRWFEGLATTELAHLYAWATGRKVVEEAPDLAANIRRINAARRKAAAQKAAMSQQQRGHNSSNDDQQQQQQQQQFSWSLLAIGLPTLVLVIIANGLFVVFCLVRRWQRRRRRWWWKRRNFADDLWEERRRRRKTRRSKQKSDGAEEVC
ncbi:MAG: hypothetical protein QWI73_06890, partial [Alphaproteobacteria bacterium]|nr:hypothetical protein [Alphaproteobacteria bacterium]